MFDILVVDESVKQILNIGNLFHLGCVYGSQCHDPVRQLITKIKNYCLRFKSVLTRTFGVSGFHVFLDFLNHIVCMFLCFDCPPPGTTSMTHRSMSISWRQRNR